MDIGYSSKFFDIVRNETNLQFPVDRETVIDTATQRMSVVLVLAGTEPRIEYRRETVTGNMGTPAATGGFSPIEILQLIPAMLKLIERNKLVTADEITEFVNSLNESRGVQLVGGESNE